MNLTEGVTTSAKSLRNFLNSLNENEIKMGFEVEFYHDSFDIMEFKNSNVRIDISDYTWDEFASKFNHIVDHVIYDESVLDYYFNDIKENHEYSTKEIVDYYIHINGEFPEYYTDSWMDEFFEQYKNENIDWREKLLNLYNELYNNEHNRNIDLNNNSDVQFLEKFIRSKLIYDGIIDGTIDLELKNGENLEDFIFEYKIWDFISKEYNFIMNLWFSENPYEAIEKNDIELEPGYKFSDDNSNVIISTSADNTFPFMEKINEIIENELNGSLEIIESTNEWASSYTSYMKELDKWYLETDDSLSEGGLEITSPVKDLNESLNDLDIILNFMRNEKEIYTSDSTGLHISISMPNLINKSPNWVKLAFLLGEKHTLQKFNRINNTYTESQIRNMLIFIKDNFNNVEKIMKHDGINKLITYLNEGIKEHRHTSFNISSYRNGGRVEFRMMGNTGYENNFSLVYETILKYAMMLKAAYSDTLFQKEFIKKLTSKLIEQYPNNPNYEKYPTSNITNKTLYRLIRKTSSDDVPMKKFHLFLSGMNVKLRNNLPAEQYNYNDFISFASSYLQDYIDKSILIENQTKLNANTLDIKEKVLRKIKNHFNITLDWFKDMGIDYPVFLGITPSALVNSYIPNVTETQWKYSSNIIFFNIIIIFILFGDKVPLEIKKRNLLFSKYMILNKPYFSKNSVVYFNLIRFMQYVVISSKLIDVRRDIFESIISIISDKRSRDKDSIRNMILLLIKHANLNIKQHLDNNMDQQYKDFVISYLEGTYNNEVY